MVEERTVVDVADGCDNWKEMAEDCKMCLLNTVAAVAAAVDDDCLPFRHSSDVRLVQAEKRRVTAR